MLVLFEFLAWIGERNRFTEHLSTSILYFNVFCIRIIFLFLIDNYDDQLQTRTHTIEASDIVTQAIGLVIRLAKCYWLFLKHRLLAYFLAYQHSHSMEDKYKTIMTKQTVAFSYVCAIVTAHRLVRLVLDIKRMCTKKKKKKRDRRERWRENQTANSKYRWNTKQMITHLYYEEKQSVHIKTNWKQV